MAEAPAAILEQMDLRKRLTAAETERDASKKQVETVRVDLGHARNLLGEMTKLVETVLSPMNDEGTVGLVKRLVDEFAEAKRQIAVLQDARALHDQERKQWQRYVECGISQMGELKSENLEVKAALAVLLANHLLKTENQRYNVLRGVDASSA